MAKLSAWLVTLIGIVYLLNVIDATLLGVAAEWIVALAFLVWGIPKLMRNYGKRK